MVENINWETFQLLEKFIYGGGKLIIFDDPTLLDGSVSEEVTRVFAKHTSVIFKLKDYSEGNIKKYFNNKNLKFEGMTGGTIYHQRRMLTDGQIIFLANSSLTEKAGGSLTTKGKDVLEMNTLTGDIFGYPNQASGDDVSISYSIPPAGSLLLFIQDTKKSDYTVPVKPQNYTAVQSATPMKVTRNEENVLMIDFCDLMVGNDNIKDLNTYYAADKVYKYYGFKNGNHWNTSVQFKTNIVDRDTFSLNTGFTATYHFPVKGKFDWSKIKAVVERTNLWTVTVNGIEVKPENGEWWLDRSYGVFNIGKAVKTGDNTITLKTSPMKIHAEIEPVYILGDFSVKQADKGWEIEAPVSAYTLGSWKSQGLPFYSWGISYSREFNIDNADGRWEVDLGNWNGTVTEVT